MNTETLQINIESPIATVTLNRPNVLNAFNEQLVLDLQKAFKTSGLFNVTVAVGD